MDLKKIAGNLVMVSLILMGGCSGVVEPELKLNTLVFSEEFDTDGAPDPSLWTYDIGTGQNGWGNNELQYYTDRAENVEIKDGFLQITAREEGYQGSAYTSARILTKGILEQEYGRIEARIQLPWGRGIWPAFWMLGNDIDNVSWPQCGEIDIMEFRGQEPTVVHGSVHGPGYSGGNAVTKTYEPVNARFDTEFHIFGVEWTQEGIKYYVDNKVYNEITPDDVPGEWVFDKPFFLILNVAVGGSFVGPPSSGTVFPQTMLVDYIRIYE